MKHSNDDAAAGIFTLIVVFLLASLMFILIGFGIDKFTLMAERMFTDTPASQMRFDVVNLQLLVFRLEPIILLICIGINYLVAEMRQNTGMADVSTMVRGAAEMIIMTLVLVAFTLFGGSAVDSVVQWVNNFPVISPDLELFGAVQYIAPVFYGIMFLALLGVVVQFVMLCVQTVDYSQTQG
jgi:hypothetical protein